MKDRWSRTPASPDEQEANNDAKIALKTRMARKRRKKRRRHAKRNAQVRKQR